jgi:hypothetical protein
MLMWHKELWLIDHGAALYFHHSWDNWQEQATRPFAPIKDHVLLPWATELDVVDGQFKSILTEDKIREIVNLIPDGWLEDENITITEKREVYIQFLITRLAASATFIEEANYARKKRF